MKRSMTVITIDTSSDPQQPSRLEKKKNMWNGSGPTPPGGRWVGPGC